jgi:hypothetical protein
MAEDPHNVRERLWSAVDALATGKGSIQQRADVAYTIIAFLRDDDFVDPKARAIMTAIREVGTAAGDGPGARLQMSDDQAAALAKQIIALDTIYRPPFDDH